MDRKTFCQILNSHLIAIQAAFNELIETDEETRAANEEQKILKGEDTPIHVSFTVYPDCYTAWTLATIDIFPEYNRCKRLFRITKTKTQGLTINTKIIEV